MSLVHELSSVLEEKREEIVAWMNKKRSEIEVPSTAVLTFVMQDGRLQLLMQISFLRDSTTPQSRTFLILQNGLQPILNDTNQVVNGFTSILNRIPGTKAMSKISEHFAISLNVPDTSALLAIPSLRESMPSTG